jgi:hypothetical protein
MFKILRTRVRRGLTSGSLIEIYCTSLRLEVDKNRLLEVRRSGSYSEEEMLKSCIICEFDSPDLKIPL